MLYNIKMKKYENIFKYITNGKYKFSIIKKIKVK